MTKDESEAHDKTMELLDTILELAQKQNAACRANAKEIDLISAILEDFYKTAVAPEAEMAFLEKALH